MTAHRLVLGAVLLLVLCGGCRRDGVYFGGRVTFEDGAPLTTGHVVFTSGLPLLYTGVLDQNGRYELGGNYDNGGVPTGKYTVYISVPTLDNAEPIVAEPFCNRETSGLSCEVKRGGHYDIVVQRPKPKERAR